MRILRGIIIYYSIEYCLMLSVSVAHREYLTLLTEKKYCRMKRMILD